MFSSTGSVKSDFVQNEMKQIKRKYLCVPVPFLIAYHLNGYEFVVLVVQTFQDLPKGAFPNHF